MTADEDDKGMYNRDELFAQLVFAMGGRSAEELVFGEPTTGASNDIEQATKIARAMVTEYGMTSALGTVKYGQAQGDAFSGMGAGAKMESSPEVAATIDKEVHTLIDAAHATAYGILEQYRDQLDTMVSKLLEKETLRRQDLEALLEGVEPHRPELPAYDIRFGRQIGREPVKTPVELAEERGEEPPKRFSILEASRETRERRRKEREKEHGAPLPPPPAGGAPTYGGPKPPSDWTYPGAPKAKPEPAPAPEPAPKPEPETHPGMDNYRPDEEIGFRLPEHERPDRPDRPSEEETKQLPRHRSNEDDQ